MTISHTIRRFIRWTIAFAATAWGALSLIIDRTLREDVSGKVLLVLAALTFIAFVIWFFYDILEGLSQ